MSTLGPATRSVSLTATLLVSIFLSSCSRSNVSRVSFLQSFQQVQAYEFVEVTARVPWPHVRNPFTDASLSGWFETSDGSKRWRVDGFCDSEDGSVFRIRFMPSQPGEYRYSVVYRQGEATKSFSGTFQGVDGHRRGLIRDDPHYPWHFLWEGTNEHYFFNGTTAFWLMGWSDEKVIQSALDRFHRLSINRVRVSVSGRALEFYGEPVMVGSNWTGFISPWPVQLADDTFHPGFDFTRFSIPFWQKFDRALEYARDRDIGISLVLEMDSDRVHPRAGSEDELRLFRYAVARLGAYSNVTWDLGDDLDSFRSEAWTHRMGTLIEVLDPYHHLATSHPANPANQDRGSEWLGFTSVQEWSRNQHSFMLKQREKQRSTGRIIPQTNEEYGYEDHYPMWSAGLGSDTADALRRTAWDIAMAGAYGTTGETARRGTNIWPDTGGGWMNGRGDDSMTMFQGYSRMVDFFTSFNWWETEPHDELVNSGNYCLANIGRIYAIYLPRGGRATVHLERGAYDAQWFNPSNGEKIALGSVDGPVWVSPEAIDHNDWALFLRRRR